MELRGKKEECGFSKLEDLQYKETDKHHTTSIKGPFACYISSVSFELVLTEL